MLVGRRQLQTAQRRPAGRERLAAAQQVGREVQGGLVGYACERLDIPCHGEPRDRSTMIRDGFVTQAKTGFQFDA